MKTKYILLSISAGALLLFNSCEKDFLERQPLTNYTPENYLTSESQLAAYAIDRYGVFATHSTNSTIEGTFGIDNNTDNQAGRTYNNIYVPGQWKTGQTGGAWSFTDIYQCNYFLQTVLPRLRAGKISGNTENINHYIGEVYMLRAFNYFAKLQSLGDFPIIKTTLPDNKDTLIAKSQRRPRTEVARFIISDLDSAIIRLKTASPDGKKNRISKLVAQQFESRVALFEATWLKNFKGTAFVPNGPGWPGADKSYNANYQFPSGSIDGEIAYFLDKAMVAAKAVADAVPLVTNNKVLPQTTSDPVNPYIAMFNELDLSGYSEVLLWRKYDKGLGVLHNVPVCVAANNSGIGLTRGLVDGFVMANGLPIYAPGSGYAGNDSIHLMRINRDGRLQLFLGVPGQINVLYPSVLGTHATPVVLYPDILNKLGNADAPTGLIQRKGISYDGAQYGNGYGYTGSILFRAVEAYLNYMEACYEKNGSLDATAQSYWQQIRNRAGVDPDYQKTINATDMSQEALNDWGAYSAGQLVNAMLYNIRRERRCELMAEGLRGMDLNRWRAMDQMINTPYHIEGFKLWGYMQKWYKASDLTYGIGDRSSVSAPSISLYLRPYEKTTTSLAFNGYRWTLAHYLSPVAIQHFMITSSDPAGADLTTSPIYQNPGWPTIPNVGPIGF